MNKICNLKNGVYGRRAILISAWDEQMSEYLKSRGVVELELNMAKGWRGDDLRFLADLSWLKSFEILDLNIPNVEPIHCLHNLRCLGITTYCSTEIRFSAFPVLERCILEWRPKATSLFDCTTLKDVFVNRYKGKDLSGFGKLTKLESLAILNSPVRDLRGLITLKRLRRLRLNNLTKLASLVGLEELTNLEELDLRGERAIRSIEELGSLSRLRRLYLDDNGDIESLGPLDKLSALEVVTFSGSTKIIDGDLSPLVRLKSLTGITFQNRRHYSHRREEFGDAYWKP